MRKLERMLRLAATPDGELKLQSSRPSDRDSYENYILELKIKVAEKQFRPETIFWETIEPITDKEEWRENERRYHFAYLNTLVDKGHENFTNSLPGVTKKEKVEALHYTMKEEYCKLHPECYQRLTNAVTGEVKVLPFSVSRDDCAISDDNLQEYYRWNKETLCELHLTKYGYEIPFWLEK